MEAYERINLDEYIQTGEGGTAQAYTRKDGKTLAKLYNPGFEADRAAAEFLTARTVYELGVLVWIMCHRMTAQRAENLFHVTPETMKAHWDIFYPAYMGSTDPQVLGPNIKRLMPFYAFKVPYVYDMAFHTALPEDSFRRIEQMISV